MKNEKCGIIDYDDRMGRTHIQLKYKEITQLALNQIYSFDILQNDLSIGLQAPLLHILDISLSYVEPIYDNLNQQYNNKYSCTRNKPYLFFFQCVLPFFFCKT